MKPSRLEKALLTLDARRTAADNDSHIAGIDARALLLVTVAYLVAMLSVPVDSAAMLMWFAVYPIVTAPLAHIPYERIFVKSLYLLPLFVAVGIFNPFYDRETAFTVAGVAVSRGWVSLISIVVRGLLSVQALLLLIFVAGWEGMCGAMRSLGLPKVLAVQLEMLYRYTGVLLAEALDMQRARSARGYGRSSYGLRLWAPMVGQLLLRTMDRAERIHRCMCARGYDGTISLAPAKRWQTPDTVYCLAWIPIFALLRFVNISALFSL